MASILTLLVPGGGGGGGGRADSARMVSLSYNFCLAKYLKLKLRDF